MLDSSSFARWNMSSKYEHVKGILCIYFLALDRACMKQNWVDIKESEALALGINLKGCQKYSVIKVNV